MAPALVRNGPDHRPEPMLHDFTTTRREVTLVRECGAVVLSLLNAIALYALHTCNQRLPPSRTQSMQRLNVHWQNSLRSAHKSNRQKILALAPALSADLATSHRCGHCWCGRGFANDSLRLNGAGAPVVHATLWQLHSAATASSVLANVASAIRLS